MAINNLSALSPEMRPCAVFATTHPAVQGQPPHRSATALDDR